MRCPSSSTAKNTAGLGVMTLLLPNCALVWLSSNASREAVHCPSGSAQTHKRRGAWRLASIRCIYMLATVLNKTGLCDAVPAEQSSAVLCSKFFALGTAVHDVHVV